MKIKAWMIYLIGLGIALLVGQTIKDSVIAGSVIGGYFFYGGAILGLYYLIQRFRSKRKEKEQLI